jgi:UDP-2,3-diacylglucosamine hydrolase
MSTLFISDLHLCDFRPSITQRFLEFLESETTKNCEALFILGDFFEVWLGDDNTDPHYQTIIQALAQFTQQGPPVYFMQGNRDFLIGKRFAKETGTHLISDPHLVELYGERVLLMHGDSLCTSDIAHQRFRKIVHNPIIQWIFL